MAYFTSTLTTAAHPVTLDPEFIGINKRSLTSAHNKLTSTATEFESILLTQWLESAERSFGTIPGDDPENDAESEQLKSLGVQELGKALAAHGGIGIASMVTRALNHVDSSSKDGVVSKSSTLSD